LRRIRRRRRQLDDVAYGYRLRCAANCALNVFCVFCKTLQNTLVFWL
jgi:hypothetical protein